MNAPAAQVAEATMKLLDTLQHSPKHLQALAAAALFIILADHLRIPAQDLKQAVTNMLVSNAGIRNPAFEAVRLYLDNEL